ncbi:MAG TPA: helix-hairpin-helix domain-containing protein [Nitrososphaeraceae archaeon]
MSVKERENWTQDSAWYNFQRLVLKPLGLTCTRDYIKKLIRELCTEANVERESIGIIAAARCTMFDADGNWRSVAFDQINSLAQEGTDIIFMEKLDSVRVIGEHGHRYGVAFVNSQGHLAEYGKDLIEAADESGAHVTIFTDDDKAGRKIATEARIPIERLGVDDEMRNHFGLSSDYVKIDDILAAVGSEAVWEYLMEKLKKLHPTRDYGRVLRKPDLSKFDPEEIKRLRDTIYKYRELITAEKWAEIESGLTEVEGFINVDEKRAEIENVLGDGIVKKDPLLNELNAKIKELKPILDKMENVLKAKEHEKHKKEQEEKERIEKEKAELAKRQQEDKERREKEKVELNKRFADVVSHFDLEIQDIEGIGPTTARKFREIGIVSVVDLAVADVDILATELNPPDIPAAGTVSPPIHLDDGRTLRLRIKKKNTYDDDDADKKLSKDDKLKAAKVTASKFIAAAKKLLEEKEQEMNKEEEKEEDK